MCLGSGCFIFKHHIFDYLISIITLTTGGDQLMVMLLRNESKNAYVQDHPSEEAVIYIKISKMQHSKDYLEREIEKLSLMLVSLIEKVTGLSSSAASDELDEIDTALQSELDLSLGKINDMQNQEFLNHISTLHETHLKHLAELLYQLVLKTDSSCLKIHYDITKIAKKTVLLIDVIDEKSKTFSMKRLEMKEHLKTF